VNKTLGNKIDTYFKRKKSLSKEELVLAIGNDFPDWSSSTVKVYLSKLKKEGIVNNPSRGTYTISHEKAFNPEIPQNLKKIADKIQKEYPYVNSCVWNTIWLNDLMLHQPFKQYSVIEVEKEAAEQVFNYLNENYKNVFLNPDNEIFELYISSLDEIIIVKNLISESPFEKINKINIPTLEKLLVDMLVDKDLFAAQQGEIEFIFKTAFSKYALNKLQMKRYAMRRNREKEIENIINISLAK
jgi:hypothetical protein